MVSSSAKMRRGQILLSNYLLSILISHCTEADRILSLLVIMFISKIKWDEHQGQCQGHAISKSVTGYQSTLFLLSG